MAVTSDPAAVKEVDPQTLRAWLQVGQALVFDVRPPEISGASGTCGMAALLARLPHNRRNLNV